MVGTIDRVISGSIQLSIPVHSMTVRLADADRGVYETLALRVARHPSETAEYLLTRVLAYCLEYSPGIAFTRGLAEPDEPAVEVRDLTGSLLRWIDIGAPEAARLHKASKMAPEVVVYAHRDVDSWLARLHGERIHRSEQLRIIAMDRDLLAAMVARLERRMDFDLSVSDRELYLSLGGTTLTGTLVERDIETDS